MKKRIDTVLFDIGNVLIRFDHCTISKSLAKYSHLNSDEVFELVFKNGIVLDYDKGNISSKDFYSLLAKILGLDSDFITFSEMWCESFYENKSMLTIVERLNNICHIGILSDTNHLHFSYMIRNFRVLQLFKKFFLSYKLKTVKSEKTIYFKILNSLKLEANRILYIDDKIELTEIAKKIGYNTISFTNIIQFKKDLLDFGINLNE